MIKLKPVTNTTNMLTIPPEVWYQYGDNALIRKLRTVSAGLNIPLIPAKKYGKNTIWEVHGRYSYTTHYRTSVFYEKGHIICRQWPSQTIIYGAHLSVVNKRLFTGTAADVSYILNAVGIKIRGKVYNVDMVSSPNRACGPPVGGLTVGDKLVPGHRHLSYNYFLIDSFTFAAKKYHSTEAPHKFYDIPHTLVVVTE